MAPPHAAAPPASARFESVRIAELFRLGRAAYLTGTVNAGILLVVLWGPHTGEALLAWFACVLGVSLGRALLHRGFARVDPGDAVPRDWEMRFAFGAFCEGALWSAAVLVFFDVSGPLLQMGLLFVVGGSVIGAAGLYAASTRTLYACIALPLAAVAVQLLTEPLPGYRLLALVVGVFAVVLMRVHRELNRSLVETLHTRLENASLVERLEASEARLLDAIESYPGGIAFFDERDRLVVGNPEFARVYATNVPRAELSGRPYAEFARAAFNAELHAADEDREKWVEDRLRRHCEGEGRSRQFQLHDGRWMQSLTARTALGGTVVAFNDVTDVKRAHAAYEALLAEENLVLDALPVGVVFLENRVIARCNRRLEEMLGWGHGELDGKSSRAWYSSDEAYRKLGADAYAQLARGEIQESDVRLTRSDGTQLWCRSLAFAVDPQAPEQSAVFVFADATERRAAERALRASEALHRNLVETSNDLIFSFDCDGRWTYLNPAAAQRIYGYSHAELLGRNFVERLVPEVRERDRAVFESVLAGKPVFDHETRHTRRDGTTVDLSFNAVPVRDEAGRIVGTTGTARDITEQKRAAAALHESVERLRLAVDAAGLYDWEWDFATGQLRYGQGPVGLPVAAGANVISRTSYAGLVHPEDRERYVAAGQVALDKGEPYSIDYRFVAAEGSQIWFSERGKLVYGPHGRPLRMIGVSQDVTERVRREEEVRYLAYHDTLTGLPNRRLLEDRLKQAVFLAQRRETRVALLAVDLDRFKEVNDALGHKAGDAVLREISNRLQGCVRRSDTLARQGGDEFVIVIPESALDTECAIVAEKILRSLAAPVTVDGREFTLGASIGVSLYPDDASDWEALLRNADVAMYRAKELGRNNYRFYGR
ncbi:MAG: PAS domain S-box protein [Betaproteobacteria bacterium]|nr:PAS domain S-box protein [Betaproteobacteria bacterium]